MALGHRWPWDQVGGARVGRGTVALRCLGCLPTITSNISGVKDAQRSRRQSIWAVYTSLRHTAKYTGFGCISYVYSLLASSRLACQDIQRIAHTAHTPYTAIHAIHHTAPSELPELSSLRQPAGWAMAVRFFISRSVDARSQPWRAWAPQHKKQKQSAEGAILWPKLSKTCGFPCILVTQATVQPSHHSIDRPDRPGPSTTRPADRPTTSHPLDPPLALGLTAL